MRSINIEIRIDMSYDAFGVGVNSDLVLVDGGRGDASGLDCRLLGLSDRC